MSNAVNSTMNLLSDAGIAQLGERQSEDLKVPASILGFGKAPRVFAAPKLQILKTNFSVKPAMTRTVRTGRMRRGSTAVNSTMNHLSDTAIAQEMKYLFSMTSNIVHKTMIEEGLEPSISSSGG